MMIFAYISLGMSGFLLAMFVVNSLLFRRSPKVMVAGNDDQTGATAGLTSSVESDGRVAGVERSEPPELPKVSALIPARDEAARIGPLLDSVLKSEGVDFEICVLDDESTDDTAAIVMRYSEQHPNVRLLQSENKPSGWCGKQYACYQLAQNAKYDEFVFLDADVTMSPDGLARAVGMRQATGVDLLSGFPKQRVVTWGEALLIPLIHQVLLCFLPFVLMRFTRMKAAAAGCGQFFITHRDAYFKVGGHSVIKHSLHDGVTLPRVYRSAGCTTNLFDASDIAVCRMYQNFNETWLGLLKNAHEGFAKMPAIVVISTMMIFAYVVPIVLVSLIGVGLLDTTLLPFAFTALAFSYLPRLIACLRYDNAWGAALLHPVSIIMFLVIQWVAWLKKVRGKVVDWRSRSYEMVPS